MEMISDSNEYKSLKEIIKQERSMNFKGKACTFKVEYGNASLVNRSRQSDSSQQRSFVPGLEEPQSRLENQFFKIRVRQQRYNGRACVVIYITEVTKKIRDKVLYIEKWE